MPAEVADILLEIVARRRHRLGTEASPLPAEPAPRAPLGAEQPFLAALGARRGRAVIAEIKMGSPRIGTLRGKLDPLRQARVYRDHGAAALSVVTEPDFFYGDYELLERCREASGLPAIAKDFIVDRRQLGWARQAGADAVLLIAALYDRKELAKWADLAREHDLVPLVETHSAADIEKLAGGEWELVGLNNRDLRTFRVDLESSMRRVGRLPPGALKVAESGIRSRAELERLRAAGFDAFLVGEALLLAEDPASLLEELAR